MNGNRNIIHYLHFPFRTRIFVEEGLDQFEEAPESIYDAALYNYFANDPEFNKKYVDLAMGRESFLEALEKRRLQNVS